MELNDLYNDYLVSTGEFPNIVAPRGSRKVSIPDVDTMNKYLFRHYREYMFAEVNTWLNEGVMASYLNADIDVSSITANECRFGNVTFWRVDRCTMIADIDIQLQLPCYAWIVKMIFELYAEGKGIFELADIVNAAGAHRLRTDKPITHKQIAYILRNEIYVGDKLLQKQHPKDLRTKLPDPNREQKSNLLLDDHESIVDRDLWNRVQERLNAPGKKFAPRRDSHPLAGKIICAECGEPFLRKSIKEHTGQHENIKVWKCKGRINGRCKASIIKEKDLIDLIGNEPKRIEKVLVGETIEVRRSA